MPEYLSYSAQVCFYNNRDEYCLRYLVDQKIPRSPQEHPAAIGSAFDAKAKSFLYRRFLGNNPEYTFDALFEKQVEKQNWDYALGEVDHVFDSYMLSGMMDELVGLIEKSTVDPRFEFDVWGNVRGVPILGKPDCVFKLGLLWIILDWKVNGYCSTRGMSPTKGFRLCKDGWPGKHSKTHGKAHSMYEMDLNARFGVSTHYMEDCGAMGVKWAEQLSMYGWALDLEVGDENVVLIIDQLVCRPIIDAYPTIRVANFRSRVRDSFQDHLADKLVDCWERIKKPETVFDSNSAEQFVQMEDYARDMAIDPDGDYFNDISRAEYRG